MTNGPAEGQSTPAQSTPENSHPAPRTEAAQPRPEGGTPAQASGEPSGHNGQANANPSPGAGHAQGQPGANGQGQHGQHGQQGEGGKGRRRRRRRRRGGQGGQPGQPGQPGQQQMQGGQGGQAMQVQGGEGVLVQPGPAPQAPPQLAAEGVLDFDGRGNVGYLRQLKRNLLAGSEDPEVPRQLIQRLRLRPGQLVQGFGQNRGQRVQLARVETIDGLAPEAVARNPQFQDLTVVDPARRIQLEHSSTDMVTRVLDLIAPIGFGQRGLIVSPPKAGKTIMLQRIAQAITENHPRAYLMVLLIDERPEEVTDMRRSITGDVLASSSDRPTSDHLQVAEMCLDRARRLVEEGRDVVILLDSITRLARAYNKEVESSGRTLTGGVDSRALERPKRIFGSARTTEEAGSLTILGTALIDTGSRMDEVIFEEFKGTGNMEVTLDRSLGERRIFPAINIPQSGTRKEEKLMTPKEYEKIRKLRQMLYAMKPADAMEKLVKKLAEFDSNDEFLDAI